EPVKRCESEHLAPSGYDGRKEIEALFYFIICHLNALCRQPRGLASAPERNRRFRIQSVERVSKWEVGRLRDHIRFPTRRWSALAGLRAAKGQEGNPTMGQAQPKRRTAL